MILDRFRLPGQVAVVTGSGRGIGAATAVALAEAGADVVLAARTEEQLNSVAAQITDVGRKAHVVPVDLADPAAAAALAETAVRIRVNAIAVGSVATSALDVVTGNDELRGRMEDATPLHRIGDAEDIAASVVYLASRAGGFVTGKVLEVDGGLQAPNLDLGLADLS